jgi:hypothetical protein
MYKSYNTKNDLQSEINRNKIILNAYLGTGYNKCCRYHYLYTT